MKKSRETRKKIDKYKTFLYHKNNRGVPFKNKTHKPQEVIQNENGDNFLLLVNKLD